MTRGRKILFRVVLVFFTLLFCLVAAEIALRCCKFRPLPELGSPNEVSMHQPDPVLGWVPKPGVHKIPPYVPGEQEITVTFRDDEARATSPQPNPQKQRIILIGCSFTMGWAISDSDTFAWKLQERHPNIEFINFGCDGYGTYQSLLRLERYFKSDEAQGHVHLAVIYGFLGHHAARNVASAEWLEMLSGYLRRGHAALPYCTYSSADKTIVRMPPTLCPQWPLEHKFALVNRMLDTYLNMTTRERHEWRFEVTKQLLSQMKTLCAANGAQLIVPVFLTSDEVEKKLGNESEKTFWPAYLREAGIPTLDPNGGVIISHEKYRVSGEGHPNGRLNSIWADQLDQALKELKILPAE